MRNYLVVVCGHEGIEGFYGPWTRVQAHDFGVMLRRMVDVAAVARYEAQDLNHAFREEHGRFPEDNEYAEVPEGLREYPYARPEQVCIQRSLDGLYDCACHEFEGWSTGKVWWM